MKIKKQKKSKQAEEPSKIPPSAGRQPPAPRPRDMRKLAVLRVLLWIVLGFVFLRGLTAILFPADIEQIAGELSGGIARVESSIVSGREAAAFAESFAYEYFTYTARSSEEYKKRLGRYCNSRLAADICDGVMLRGGAKAVYASAVEVTHYSDIQQDVTVVVIADYLTEAPVMIDGKETLQPVTVSATTYLTVPVYLSTGGYLVEDLPMVAPPPTAATDYELREYAGVSADEGVKQRAEAMLGDFFKTLYSAEQQRIDYYLTEDANKQRLREINGSMTFSRMESVAVYKGATAGTYLGIVALRLEDTSGSPIKQRFNMTLVENGSRLYVKDINLRSHNLKE